MSIVNNDINEILEDKNIPWSELNNKSIFITGATGLIGSLIVKSLIRYGNGVNIYAFVRNEEKAKAMFGDNVNYVIGDINNPINLEVKMDYIIHCASETSSKMFVNDPVGIIKTSVSGTYNILEFARKNDLKGLIYTSTMETYGFPDTEEKIDEKHACNLNTMNLRSSYPESKRLCENLCCAYASQYNVPVKVVRLTQTFGSGVSYNDGRVFAEFARCAIENRNIVLNTDGSTKRNYLYISDAVRAILTILLKGENGESYNAANEKTYCSIKEMAELVAKECNGSIDVEFNISDKTEHGYAPKLYMNLDAGKLRNLGWKPYVDLKESYKRLIGDLLGN